MRQHLVVRERKVTLHEDRQAVCAELFGFARQSHRFFGCNRRDTGDHRNAAAHLAYRGANDFAPFIR